MSDPNPDLANSRRLVWRGLFGILLLLVVVTVFVLVRSGDRPATPAGPTITPLPTGAVIVLTPTGITATPNPTSEVVAPTTAALPRPPSTAGASTILPAPPAAFEPTTTPSVVPVPDARAMTTPAPPPATIPAPAATDAPATSGVLGLFVMPEDGRGPLIEEIQAAQESITLEVYLLSDFDTIESLAAAQRRGVQVRVMLEEHPYGGGEDPKDSFQRLQNAGIDVRWSNPVFRFSHIKAMTVDERVAIIMNMNLTRAAFTRNREFNMISTRPEDVHETLAIFNADWVQTDIADPGSLVVSPLNSRAELLALITSAQSTLDIYAEAISDREFIDAITLTAERGVRVRLIMSPADARTTAVQQALAEAGVEVRLLGTPYIHAKMFLVDGKQAFVGSENMTATSLDLNRELGLIFDDRGSIERIRRTFEADFTNGKELAAP